MWSCRRRNCPWLLRQWKKCRGSDSRSTRLLQRHKMPPSASPTSEIDAGDLNRRMRRDILYSARVRDVELARKPPGPASQQPDRWKRLLRSQQASERRPREWRRATRESKRRRWILRPSDLILASGPRIDTRQSFRSAAECSGCMKTQRGEDSQ